MYERKIISLGRSSLVVSLPKQWIKLNDLKQGDVVSLKIQSDGSLVVYSKPTKGPEVREITLHVDPSERSEWLVRKIIACYLNGYRTIRLVSTDIFTLAQQKAIRNIVRVLYMRIMDSDARNIYIQTLIDETKASLSTAVRRMYTICSSMVRDSFEALRNQDIELAKVVCSLDDDVDHFGFFLVRLLRGALIDPSLCEYLKIESVDCIDYLTLVYRIEHVADHASSIAKNVIILNCRGQKLEDPLLKSIILMSNEALKAFNEAVNAFFSGDEAASNDVIEYQGKVETLDRKAAEILAGETNALKVCVTCSIRDSIKRIVEYSADIAEVTINHSYKPKSQT